MVMIYNRNCKLASVKTSDRYLFDKIHNHFLTYRQSSTMFKHIGQNDCLTSDVVVKSVIGDLEYAAGNRPSGEQIRRIQEAKKMVGLPGMINLYYVDQELFDQIEPLNS